MIRSTMDASMDALVPATPTTTRQRRDDGECWAMAVGDAQVDPDDLEHFGKQLDKVAERLTDSKGHAHRLMKETERDPGAAYPLLGRFDSANSLRDSYEGKLTEMGTAFGQLNTLVKTLADASREIAKKYRTAEEFNKASVKDIDNLLGGTQQPGTTENPDNGNPPV
jgi:hypothetical protein